MGAHTPLRAAALLLVAFGVAACGGDGGGDNDPVIVTPPPPVVEDPVTEPRVQADFGPVFDRAFAQNRFDEPIDVSPGDITATDPAADPVDVEPG